MSEHTKAFADSVASGRKQPIIEREALRRELNAARALLREVLEADDEAISMLSAIELSPAIEMIGLTEKIRAYLDACDKPGEPT